MKTLALSIVVVVGVSIGSYHLGSQHWSMDQRDFPCAEDEYLGYSPESTNKVVCLHVEQLTSRTDAQ